LELRVEGDMIRSVKASFENSTVSIRLKDLLGPVTRVQKKKKRRLGRVQVQGLGVGFGA